MIVEKSIYRTSNGCYSSFFLSGIKRSPVRAPNYPQYKSRNTTFVRVLREDDICQEPVPIFKLYSETPDLYTTLHEKAVDVRKETLFF